MEADWEIEVGPDSPVIDLGWAGYVDLRSMPERIVEIGETTQFPALAESLIRLNSTLSRVRTVKCDVWPIETSDPNVFNADEFDAGREDTSSALACYIDLVSVEDLGSPTLGEIEGWCKRLCSALKSRPLRKCRADMIVRRAVVAAGQEWLGVTAYVAGCGAPDDQALEALSSALATFTDSVLAAGAVGPQA
jgi:hypothetical protein